MSTPLSPPDSKSKTPFEMNVLLTLPSDKKGRQLQVVVPVDFFILHLHQRNLLRLPPVLITVLLRYLKEAAADLTPEETAVLLASLEDCNLLDDSNCNLLQGPSKASST